jgi:hypothetical protein
MELNDAARGLIGKGADATLVTLHPRRTAHGRSQRSPAGRDDRVN